MKKYLCTGIVGCSLATILIIPFRNSQNENGLIIFNSNKSFVVFIPVNNLNIDVCGSGIQKLSDLEGFQFKYALENSNQFFVPQCHIITGAQSEQYPPEVTNWYISKCNIKFTHRESIFSTLFSRPHYEKFVLEMNNKLFIKFKYTVPNHVDEIQLKEIK